MILSRCYYKSSTLALNPMLEKMCLKKTYKVIIGWVMENHFKYCISQSKRCKNNQINGYTSLLHSHFGGKNEKVLFLQIWIFFRLICFKDLRCDVIWFMTSCHRLLQDVINIFVWSLWGCLF